MNQMSALALGLGFGIGGAAILVAMIYWTVFCCCHKMLIGWCNPRIWKQKTVMNEDLEAAAERRPPQELLVLIETRRRKKMAAERDARYRWRDSAPFRSPLEHPPDAIHAASPEQLRDKRFVLRQVASHGDALTLASPELKADFDVVRAACTHSGRALRFADAALRADRTVVLAAVSQNGRALKHASAELQADRDVVVAAVRSKGPAALRYAHSSLKCYFGVHNAMTYHSVHGASCSAATAPTTPTSAFPAGGFADTPVATEAQPRPALLERPSASA